MKTVWVDPITRTICDLTAEPLPDGQPAYNVNRVNTPAEHRGEGHASRLLRDEVLPAADAESVVLFLWIQPTGPLDYNALARWYHRLGFRPREFTYGDGAKVELWVREPLALRMLHGPTRNHLLSYEQPPLPEKRGVRRSWYFAKCGYKTCDEERIDNPDWRDAPLCRRCLSDAS